MHLWKCPAPCPSAVCPRHREIIQQFSLFARHMYDISGQISASDTVEIQHDHSRNKLEAVRDICSKNNI